MFEDFALAPSVAEFDVNPIRIDTTGRIAAPDALVIGSGAAFTEITRGGHCDCLTYDYILDRSSWRRADAMVKLFSAEEPDMRAWLPPAAGEPVVGRRLRHLRDQGARRRTDRGDLLLSDAEKASNWTMLVCVSRCGSSELILDLG